MGESWNALAHIRQAVTFLVIHQKHRKSFREITEDLCGALSVQQLYRISTMYWDDRWVVLRWAAGVDLEGGRGVQGGSVAGWSRHACRCPLLSPSSGVWLGWQLPGVHHSLHPPLLTRPHPTTRPPCRYNTETVSPEVLAQMKAAMQESSSSAASHSFLLDDDSAIPFSHADVERMVDDKVGGGAC